MWHASIYLAPGDIASQELDDDRDYNRAAVADNSLRYGEMPNRAKSPLMDMDIDP
jgi:hypothetical protein